MSQAWVGDGSVVSRPFPLNDPTSVDATLIYNVLSASGGMDGWMGTHAHTETHALKLQRLWFQTGPQRSLNV